MSSERTCARCSEAQPGLIDSYDGREFCTECFEMCGGASMPAFVRDHDRIVLRGLAGFLELARRDDDGWRLVFDRRGHPGRVRFEQRSHTGKILFEAWGDFSRMVEWLENRREHLEEQQRHSPDLARCVALAYLHAAADPTDGDAAPFPARARATNPFASAPRA